MSVAILHARASNAHCYDTQNYPHHQRSLLKRIWWCCIVRDRVLAIGMRRPLQITQHDFDFSKHSIQQADFKDEIPMSEVYTQQTKEQLWDVFVAQCQLAVAMTNPISVLYPAIRSKVTDSHGDVNNELDSCVEGISHLKIWELGYLMPIEDRQVDVHATVKFFAHLTSLYYQYGLPSHAYTSFDIDMKILFQVNTCCTLSSHGFIALHSRRSAMASKSSDKYPPNQGRAY